MEDQKNIQIPYPNPEKQEMFDAVLKRLTEDEKYLFYAYSIMDLTPTQYELTYSLITYHFSPKVKKDAPPPPKPRGKYAAKF